MKSKFLNIFIFIFLVFSLVGCAGEQGPVGPQGEQGIQGEKGDDGHTPKITIGENGNWYIDGVDTGVIAEAKNGEDGESGQDGTSLLTGYTEPSKELGKDGDAYINLDNWNFYVKNNGVWIYEGNIKGSSEDAHNGTEGLEFYPINDTECAVAVGKAKLLKEIVIPSKYKNYTVTTIYGDILGNGGFVACENLEKITIPESIIIIDDYAFNNCINLKEVVIPDSAISIGNGAFNGCSSLTNIEIPESVTSIGNNVFSGCSSLTSIEISNGVTSIGNYAFNGCSSLTNIEIPESVTSIGIYAFSGCSSLTSIEIPFVGATLNGTSDTHFGYIFGASSYSHNKDKVPTSLKEVIITGGTSIGSYAFDDCSSLTSIVIPEGVTSIGSSAFDYCSSLENVYYNGTIEELCNLSFGSYVSNPMYYADNIYMIDENGDIEYNGKKYKLLTDVVVPDSVTSIGSKAFFGCNSLTTIEIPDSVTSIGDDAFSYCSSLENVYYNGTIEDWLNITFNDYDSNPMSYADNLYFLDECGDIEYNGAKYKLLSSNLVIPESVTSIDSYAFWNCSSLTSIVIPEGITSIGSSAFENCSSLTIYCEASTKPSGWNSDWNSDNRPVYWSVSKEDIIKIEGIQYLIIEEEAVVTRCTGNLSEVVLPSVIEVNETPYSVTSIGSYAFSRCSSLTSIVIPNSVTSIGSSAFDNCSSLTSIVIPNSVASIGYKAFDNCSSLTSIIIPEGVTRIEDYAFCNCSSLISIALPNSVTSIGSSAFWNCSSLTSIVIPNSVASIGAFAFSDCSSLIIYCEASSEPSGWYSLDRPVYWGISKDDIITTNGIQYVIKDGKAIVTRYVGNDANVEIPSTIEKDGVTYNVTSIGLSAFDNCSSLTSIIIPEGVTRIEDYAFCNCSSLISIALPSTLTSIGYKAFDNCSSLTIYCEASSKPSGWNSSWNFSNRPVYWAGEWEYDANGNSVPLN